MVQHAKTHFAAVFISLFWLVAMLCSIESYGQLEESIDTIEIFKMTQSTPTVFAEKSDILARQICKNYPDEASKVLAIVYWITEHIQYDYKSYKKRSISNKSTETVLKKKKALCGEYAQLFKEMCNAVDIEAEVVTGYTQGFDFFETDTLYRAEHAWSVVRVNGQWKLMDLTLASGYVAPRKQGFQKFLADAFGVKHWQQYKFVQEFNPKWLYVAPDEMIFTHYPNLSMFQLLQVPIPINAYIEGSWAIHGHLAWHFKTLKESEAIDAFVQKNQIEKWLQEAEEGFKNNPSNHRIKGFNYYLVLDSLFRAAFDEKTTCLNLPKKKLELLENYAVVADSMLRLSMEDNHREFRRKEWQSNWWKQRLCNSNKNYQLSFGQRCNLNLSQEQLVAKIEKDNKNYQKFALQQAHDCQEKTPYSITAPSAELKENYQFLAPIDSLQKLAEQALYQKDSFMLSYKEGIATQVCAKEHIVMEIHRGNFKALQKRNKEKIADMPMVYYDTKNLDKNWLNHSHNRADSINKAVTNIFLFALNNDQQATYDLVKQYYEAVSLKLQLIHQAKAHALQEQDYINALTDLERQLKNYHTELKNCMGFQQKLLQLLDKEVKFMQSAAKTLSSEDALEQHRHQAYMQYRKFIKQTENAKAQFLIQRIEEMKLLIEESKQN